MSAQVALSGAILDRVNYLNMGLMAVAALVAFFFPFETFLGAYAILGPLHYLTQISWLHDRKYFTKGKWDALWLFALVIPTGFPLLTSFGRSIYLYNPVGIAFFSAFICVLIQNPLLKVVAILISIPLVNLLSEQQETFYLFTYFLPTLIHVFVFTLLFMLLGSLKQRSRSGFIHLGFYVAIAVATILFPYPLSHVPSEYVKNSMKIFDSFNREVASLLRWPHTEPWTARAMRFIAFAYTYHYLNWFSKTRVIQWHRIRKRRLILITTLFIASVGVYAYDYKLGLWTLYYLSLGHVLLEFPLNFRSLGTIVTELGTLRSK